MFPIEITYKGFASSDALRRRIHQEAKKLDRLFPRIIDCQVIISIPHRAQNQGKIYHVTIKLHVPGKTMVVGHEPEHNHAHEDAFVSIRDSFRAMERELVRFTRKRSEQRIKETLVRQKHKDQLHGEISFLNDIDGHGLIQGEDAISYYFHQNSILNCDFNDLQKGDHVKFASEMGDKGPQASSLSLIGH